jgi:hypothetical protein
MQAAVAPIMPKSTRIHPKPATTITTTLYDLVAAINDEVGANEDALVTATVMHLLHSGRVKFLGDHEDIKVACA